MTVVDYGYKVIGGKLMKKWSVYLSKDDRAFLKQYVRDFNWLNGYGALNESEFLRELIRTAKTQYTAKLIRENRGQVVRCKSCRKTWLVDTEGDFRCPYCDEGDGDHHLESVD
jgi:hypothetical protein